MTMELVEQNNPSVSTAANEQSGANSGVAVEQSAANKTMVDAGDNRPDLPTGLEFCAAVAGILEKIGAHHDPAFADFLDKFRACRAYADKPAN